MLILIRYLKSVLLLAIFYPFISQKNLDSILKFICEYGYDTQTLSSFSVKLGP